ncbi:hypothetical protein [Parasitella parasitica]|uniref:N-terminal Ras-GEF domain-containing protein n=1 Tax=Parasitella parasitica TaxID=35722 RepID=A0A0B7N5A2_9FUNG|nr:hypothetical protein [Parasitella parasitica]
MFSTMPCSVSPLNATPTLQKRRSRSLDDIVLKGDGDPLSCYQDSFTPTSPVVAIQDAPPKRRHSVHEPHQRLATIYGWVTAAKPSRRMHESSRCLQVSRSFSHIPAAVDNEDDLPSPVAFATASDRNNTSKLTRMLEKTRNISLLFPNKTITGSTSFPPHHHHHLLQQHHPLQQILDPMQARQHESWDEPQLKKPPQQQPQSTENSPPPLPIENDPHIFDLLAKDASTFIHYGKADATITSATVEKLIEKLTREMDSEFIMDFFLTYRQFLSPIKLCKLLILRFRWALLQDDDEHVLIRIRTFVVIRHWLTHYWTYDFATSRTLRYVLCTFLTQLQSNPVILASPRDDRIVKNLRNVLKRQRKFYQHWVDPVQEQNHCGKLPSRKDSAIAISSCRDTIHEDNVCTSRTPAPFSSSWTSRMRRSLSRTVSMRQQQHSHAAALPPTLYSTVNNAPPCSCSLTDSSLGINGSSASLNSRHKQQCMLQQPSTKPAVLHSNSPSRFFRPSSFSTNTASHYRPLILKYRSEIIAQQFCLIEKAMLQNVTWDELVDLRWRKRSAARESYVIDMTTLNDDDVHVGVDQMIGFFNMTCQWVASEIVRSRHLDTRILLGLQSPAVSRLDKTWQRVDHCQMELFNQLKEMAKPFKNWKNIRDCMTKATDEVAESFAVESVLTKSLKSFDSANGCIPFLGLYLSDLVFVAELPTFIEATCAHENDEDEDAETRRNDRDLCERLSHSLVNYNKFRITASVVKHVLSFQVLSRAYSFKIHPTLYTHLRSISSLDNAEIRKASFLCEE